MTDESVLPSAPTSGVKTKITSPRFLCRASSLPGAVARSGRSGVCPNGLAGQLRRLEPEEVLYLILPFRDCLFISLTLLDVVRARFGIDVS